MTPERHVRLQKSDRSWTFYWKPGDEESLVQYVCRMGREKLDGFDWFDAALVVHQIAAQSNRRIKLPEAA